jgi:hypothetical protein
MRRWRVIVATAVLLSVSVVVPGSALAGNAPGDGCVPGTVWDDPESGVTYICIYDEMYGGTRWDVLPKPGQSDGQAFLFRSSAYGCAYGMAGLTALAGGGANMLVRSYRWPCATIVDRTWEPAGELRARVVLQRFSGSWATCRDTGYRYSTVVANGWIAGLDMGAVPDCGSGTYRTWGFGQLFSGGLWRGGSVLTSPLYIP